MVERMVIDFNEMISIFKNNFILFDFVNMMSYELKNENCKDVLKNMDMFCFFLLCRFIEYK